MPAPATGRARPGRRHPIETSAPAPCRLTVYLARDAPIGVVLRRGPSAWVRLSVWRTDADTFEHGQWFAGRVYERRSDVSADGSLFVYFARKSGGLAAQPYPHDTWAAISRPPYFTALALWFVGGTYYTGGYFPAPRRLRMAPGLPPYVDRTNNWTDRTVYVNRLLRDGWEPVPDALAETWQRRHPTQPQTLVMTQAGFDFAAYGGPYVMEYAVRTAPGAEPLSLGPATWADWDQGGRLVLARDGALYEWQAPGTLRPLANFNDQVPEPAPAPPWAEEWPARDRPPRPPNPGGRE
jgi:hypothetical protein